MRFVYSSPDDCRTIFQWYKLLIHFPQYIHVYKGNILLNEFYPILIDRQPQLAVMSLSTKRMSIIHFNNKVLHRQTFPRQHYKWLIQ